MRQSVLYPVRIKWEENTMKASDTLLFRASRIMIFCTVLGMVFLFCDRNRSPNQPQSIVQENPEPESQIPDPPQAVPGETPSGNLIHISGCKGNTGVAAKTDAPRNMECIQWTYDSAGTLYLTHINTGFNCCPDSIFAVITIDDTCICIQEGELDGLCDCLCLYDLEFLFEDIPASEWTVCIEGLYRNDGDLPLEHVINLADSTEGQFCVQRNHYPWGE
jgi:hypothetical protein